MATKPGKLHEVDLEDLDQSAFEAWGYVYLKVQRGDDTYSVRVKVNSVPQETIDQIRKKAPRPPSKTVMLDPSNPDHASLTQTRQKANVPDFADPEYVALKEAFDLNFRNEVVGRGVATKLVLKDGTDAVTPEQKYQALAERGLSGFHFSEIAQRILELTQWSEEERTNFSKSGSVPSQDR